MAIDELSHIIGNVSRKFFLSFSMAARSKGSLVPLFQPGKF